MISQSESNLDQRLAIIGVNLSCQPPFCEFTDIEKTLILACREIPHESRFPDLLLSWVRFHGQLVNVARLEKMREAEDDWISFLALYAVRHCGFSEWQPLIKRPKEILTTACSLEMADIDIAYRGEEEWSKDSGFLVSKTKYERTKAKWITSRENLVHYSVHFKNKLQYGATAKADIATAIEAGIENPEKIADVCKCSVDEVIDFIKSK